MKHKNIPLNERIIFALDVDSKEEAEKWLNLLGKHINFYKVGLQLFLAEWFPVIEMITERGHKVMADLKIFDVPEIMAQLLCDLLYEKVAERDSLQSLVAITDGIEGRGSCFTSIFNLTVGSN